MFSGRDVSFSRGGYPLVHPFSFHLKAGEWVTVRGSNGTGKSSFLRLLAGLLPCTTGTFQWDGSSFCLSDPPHRKRVAYMATLPEAFSLPTSLQKVPSLLQKWGLETWEDLPLRVLSQGQKQRAALLELSLSQRPLWLLDEPTQHLDDKGQELFLETLKHHLEKGGLAFVATHDLLSLASHQPLVLAFS